MSEWQQFGLGLLIAIVIIGWTLLAWRVGYGDGKLDEREKWEFKRFDAAIERLHPKGPLLKYNKNAAQKPPAG